MSHDQSHMTYAAKGPEGVSVWSLSYMQWILMASWMFPVTHFVVTKTCTHFIRS